MSNVLEIAFDEGYRTTDINNVKILSYGIVEEHAEGKTPQKKAYIEVDDGGNLITYMLSEKTIYIGEDKKLHIKSFTDFAKMLKSLINLKVDITELNLDSKTWKTSPDLAGMICSMKCEKTGSKDGKDYFNMTEFTALHTGKETAKETEQSKIPKVTLDEAQYNIWESIVLDLLNKSKEKQITPQEAYMQMKATQPVEKHKELSASRQPAFEEMVTRSLIKFNDKGIIIPY